MYIYVYVYTYIYPHIYVYLCACIDVLTHTGTHIHTHSHTQTHTHTHTHTQGLQEDLLCLFTLIDGVTMLSDGGEEIACPFVSVRDFVRLTQEIGKINYDL